jgi:hypothetical protein
VLRPQALGLTELQPNPTFLSQFSKKNMSSQLILDMSTAEGKGDLLRPVDGEVFIHPTSAGPFEMVPDTIAAAGVAECAASSLTPAEVQALVIKASQEEGFDQRLALAVAGQESGFNANATL